MDSHSIFWRVRIKYQNPDDIKCELTLRMLMWICLSQIVNVVSNTPNMATLKTWMMNRENLFFCLSHYASLLLHDFDIMKIFFMMRGMTL